MCWLLNSYTKSNRYKNLHKVINFQSSRKLHKIVIIINNKKVSLYQTHVHMAAHIRNVCSRNAIIIINSCRFTQFSFPSLVPTSSWFHKHVLFATIDSLRSVFISLNIKKVALKVTIRVTLVDFIINLKQYSYYWDRVH